MTTAIRFPVVEVRWPAMEMLPSYVDALRRGWSPDTVRAAAAADELAAIEADPAAFVASMVDREAAGGPITLPDGTKAARLPGYRKWLWDGEFCGSIGFRWKPGTEELPAHVLGHIGYAVVPWKQRRGYATAALRAMLDGARAEGLRWVLLTTHLANTASQRVIEANGGVLVEEFDMGSHYGGACGRRFRIELR
jgi:predicted acetyltransferase